MKSHFKLVAVSLLTAAIWGNAAATGIPVVDGLNVTQTTITALEAVEQTAKQLEQYQTQLQQYEDQIKNSVAPAAWVWDKATRTMNKVLETIDTLNYYKQQAGNIDAYLAKFKKVSTYRGMSCFQKTGCTDAERAAVAESTTEGSASQKNANDALMKSIQSQQDAITNDAASLEQLQANAQSAGGRLEAIQYANQLSSHQANQLLQIRTLLVSQQAADVARKQAIVDQEAKEQAASEQVRQGTYTASPSASW